MKPYGSPGRDTSIVAYEEGADFIRVEFRNDGVYLYDRERPGPLHVERMKQLARAGRGLSTFISQRVQREHLPITTECK